MFEVRQHMKASEAASESEAAPDPSTGVRDARQGSGAADSAELPLPEAISSALNATLEDEEKGQNRPYKLKLCVWNIQGLVTYKLDSPDFISIVQCHNYWYGTIWCEIQPTVQFWYVAISTVELRHYRIMFYMTHSSPRRLHRRWWKCYSKA